MQTFTAPGRSPSDSRCTNDGLCSSGVSDDAFGSSAVLTDAQQLSFDPRGSEAEVRLCSGKNFRIQSKLTVWVKGLSFKTTGLNYLSTPVKMHWLLFNELKWGLQPPSAAPFSVCVLCLWKYFSMCLHWQYPHALVKVVLNVTNKKEKKKSLIELHPHVRANAKNPTCAKNNVSKKGKTVT